jgi:hypothetical protein
LKVVSLRFRDQQSPFSPNRDRKGNGIGLRANEGRPDHQGCQEAIEVRTLLGPLQRVQSAAMSLDRALGASLAQQMIGTAQALTKMSPSAREDSAAEERASAIRRLA